MLKVQLSGEVQKSAEVKLDGRNRSFESAHGLGRLRIRGRRRQDHLPLFP